MSIDFSSPMSPLIEGRERAEDRLPLLSEFFLFSVCSLRSYLFGVQTETGIILRNHSEIVLDPLFVGTAGIDNTLEVRPERGHWKDNFAPQKLSKDLTLEPDVSGSVSSTVRRSYIDNWSHTSPVNIERYHASGQCLSIQSRAYLLAVNMSIPIIGAG